MRGLRTVLVSSCRRMSGFRTKQIKGPALGAFQLIGDPMLTEHYAQGGFNAVLVDMQHGLFSEKTAFDCIHRLEKFPNCFGLIRVSDNTPGLVQRALDAGANGILCPMINTAEEAEFLVKSCRYPPQGVRSWGPSRALASYNTEEANNAVQVFAMIETREALNNLDAILDVEGLDGAFVGPCDLSISLGVTPPLSTPTAPHVIEAITRVREGCKARGKIGMLFVGDKVRAQEALTEGWSVAFPAADISWMVNAISEITDIPIMKNTY